MNCIPSLIDRFQTKNDTEYAEGKQKLKRYAENGSKIALIGLVASIALALVSLCFGSVLGLLIAAPLFYFTYNAYIVSENGKKFADNPRNYMSNCGLGGSVNKTKLCEDLSSGTFLFNWAVDKLVAQVFRDIKS